MQSNQRPQITKRVIIINQKRSDVLNENQNKINTNEIADEVKQLQIQYTLNQQKFEELSTVVADLKKRVDFLESSFDSLEHLYRKKKKRRTAAEIDKTFKVSIEIQQCSQCDKTYGSEVSLNLHVRFKH